MEKPPDAGCTVAPDIDADLFEWEVVTAGGLVAAGKTHGFCDGTRWAVAEDAVGWACQAYACCELLHLVQTILGDVP